MNKLGVAVMLVVSGMASVLVAGQYSEAVLNLSPDAYYRFNNASPATGDAVVNQGTAGTVINGSWGIAGTTMTTPVGTASMIPTTHVITPGGPAALGMDADNKAPGFMGSGQAGIPGAYNTQIQLGTSAAVQSVFNAPVMTWSLWFRDNTDYGNYECLIANVPGVNTLRLTLYQTQMIVSTGPGSYAQGQMAMEQNGSYLYGNWHNIVVVKTGSNAISDIQVYEDGSSLLWGDVFNPTDPGFTKSYQEPDGTAASIGSQSSRDYSVGWGAFGYQRPAGTPDAQIDEVAVWDRALTEAEITAMFNAAINDPKSLNYVNGDTDRNRIIDGIDLATLAQNWDPLGGAQRRWAQGDFNGDGVIDGVDLAALAQGWAPLGYTGGAVPEPATLSLLVLGGLAALRRRK